MISRIEQIQRAFDEEQKSRDKKVFDATELPTTFDALTPEWLTDVLCKNVADAKVISYSLGPVDNGSSNRRRIGVVYNDAGRSAGLPERLFAKASHGVLNRILFGLAGAAEYETAFFETVRDRLNIEAPVSVFSEYDPNSFNMLTLMHDMGDRVTFCDHKTKINQEQVSNQVGLLAATHGAAYRDPQIRAAFDRFLTWPKYFDRQRPYGIQEGSEAGIQDARGSLPARLYARASDIWPAIEAATKIHEKLPATFSHGDPHLKNWYVTKDGAMGLGDWQCCNIGHHSRDLAYTISTALEPEDRRNWERELVRLYADELQKQGGPKEPFDELFLRYRQQMATALVWWTIALHPTDLLPEMQPRDCSLEFVRRMAIAADDLDTLDSFD